MNEKTVWCIIYECNSHSWSRDPFQKGFSFHLYELRTSAPFRYFLFILPLATSSFYSVNILVSFSIYFLSLFFIPVSHPTFSLHAFSLDFLSLIFSIYFPFHFLILHLFPTFHPSHSGFLSQLSFCTRSHFFSTFSFYLFF